MVPGGRSRAVPTRVFFTAGDEVSRENVSHECPRCGADLSSLSLGGATAVGCDDCGYADVEADHSGEPEFAESWADALARFEESQ